jgi:hypothetical protein
MDKQTVSNESGIKTTYATLESKASGWNMRIGIPFTLAEKKTGKQKSVNKAKKTNSCDRIRTEYKYRCIMQ